MLGMDISPAYAHITVHDYDEALGFYRDVLGLEVAHDVGGGAQRWVTLSAPGQAGRAGTQVVLSSAHAGRSAEDGDTLLALLTKGALDPVVFVVKDLDTTFEAVRASGAEVMQEPVTQPWGPRDAAFRDPAGNMVRFNEFNESE